MPYHRIASGRRRPVLATLGLLLGLAALPGAAHAQAQCENDPEVGNWSNTTPQAGSIASLEINCQGNGSWSVRASGTCERANCDWRPVPAQKLASGQVFAVYSRGAARYNLYAKANNPNLLQVYIWTSYSDGRADRETRNNFTRR